MKTRSGFVSNSSSTSFVVVCSPINNFEDINPNDLRGIYAYTTDSGYFFQECGNYFHISHEIYDFLKNHRDQIDDGCSLSYYRVYWMKDEGDGELITKKNLQAVINMMPEDVKISVENWDISCHATGDVTSLRECCFTQVPHVESEAVKYLDKKERLEAELKRMEKAAAKDTRLFREIIKAKDRKKVK